LNNLGPSKANFIIFKIAIKLVFDYHMTWSDEFGTMESIQKVLFKFLLA